MWVTWNESRVEKTYQPNCFPRNTSCWMLGIWYPRELHNILKLQERARKRQDSLLSFQSMWSCQGGLIDGCESSPERKVKLLAHLAQRNWRYILVAWSTLANSFSSRLVRACFVMRWVSWDRWERIHTWRNNCWHRKPKLSSLVKI
jgi:hypothetical protein